jgi:hypothetical protein
MNSPAINLWELITSAAHHDDRPGDHNINQQHLTDLAQSARFSGQELSIEATEDGWLIEVFSCYESKTDWSIQITILKKGGILIKEET